MVLKPKFKIINKVIQIICKCPFATGHLFDGHQRKINTGTCIYLE